jgi:CheY-like chemotaxis protein
MVLINAPMNDPGGFKKGLTQPPQGTRLFRKGTYITAKPSESNLGTSIKSPLLDSNDTRQLFPATKKKDYPVLLIEGYQSVREGIQKLIEQFGYSIKATEGLTDALKSAEGQRPSVIVIDAQTISTYVSTYVSTYDTNEGNYPVGPLREAMEKLRAAAPDAKILCMAIAFESGIGEQIRKTGADKVVEKIAFVRDLPHSIDDVMPVRFEPAEKKEMPETAVETITEPQQKKEVKTARVLVVDDNEAIRELLPDALEDPGAYKEEKESCLDLNIKVETGEDGVLGLARYTEAFESGNPYDLVISDNNMPNMSGAEMVRKIKGMNPDAKVVFMTAYDEDEELAPLRKVKPDAILGKPYDNAQLVALVFGILAGQNVSARPENLLAPAGNGITQSLQ